MKKIDHIVYAVPNLEKAIQEMSKRLGVQVTYGGQHKSEGTHNALVNLGNACYLELLAIDKSNTDISHARWMGIDNINTPQITRWAIKSTDLKQDAAILKKANANMGEIKEGSRKKTDGTTLTWALAMPLAQPLVEILPFMVDWKDSVHPTEHMPDVCKLVELQATHPQPKMLLPILKELGVAINLIQGKKATLRVILDTPNGRVKL